MPTLLGRFCVDMIMLWPHDSWPHSIWPRDVWSWVLQIAAKWLPCFLLVILLLFLQCFKYRLNKWKEWCSDLAPITQLFSLLPTFLSAGPLLSGYPSWPPSISGYSPRSLGSLNPFIAISFFTVITLASLLPFASWENLLKSMSISTSIPRSHHYQHSLCLSFHISLFIPFAQFSLA